MNTFMTKQLDRSRQSRKMSDASRATPKASSTTESESSGGFKSFWRTTDKSAQQQNVTFVQQDPSSKKSTLAVGQSSYHERTRLTLRVEPNRISRLLRQGSTTSSPEDAEASGATSAQKRRQQVYQAQKRHRNRKAEYVHTLEEEVARLQHLDALINNEKTTLEHQNKAMRELLASKSLDVGFDTMNLSNSSYSGDGLSQLGGAAVDIRFDPVMGHERTFLDFDDVDMMWTSDETTSGSEREGKRQVRDSPVAGDSWAALDFILALEWPCREHIHHSSINPNIKVPEACSIADLHGHALTATAAVYQSSLPPSTHGHEHARAASHSHGGQHSTQPGKWQLPHCEIDKLVELSELLQLDEESLTPAQAYTAVRSNIPSEKWLRPTLDSLKTPLSSLVQCHGFGACMDAPMFWQHLDAAMEKLKFTRPELASDAS
ncbi:uncharacterized protein LTR77_009091 [Saxophila tyrrhenica]|uniref:BZIP domain-containing protein n=1 Tax=Saxophila tyrrhenica TaxID=1690608 RepID=A0AAV9P3G8_9PEZI|nr:hypothetical protein LTR77_009091 [Saxophila tyrrhenica]